MILSEDARAVRKQQQNARLAAKSAAAKSGDWAAYSAFFAGQGIEVAKAEHNAKITRARQLVRSTKDAVALAQITGESIHATLASANTAQVNLSALVNEKQVLFDRSTSFGISGSE